MVRYLTLGSALWLIFSPLCHAQMLTADLEIKRVNVGSAWQTIQLENSYAEAVPVCTYNLTSASNPPATTRIRSVTSTSFDIRLQQFENSSNVTASDVHCVIADVGAHNSGGLKYEARKVLSTGTSGLEIGWGAATTENVTSSITQSYNDPHVVGQVMSFNDVNASVFWNFDCDNRGNGAFFSGQADGICVGKHIGQIDGTRASETLGYIVIEAGSGTVNDITFAAAVGPDIGGGVGNNPPNTYSVTGDFDTGVLASAGEDGGQGGWAILYGANPLPNGQIAWSIDEETVAGDTSRTHTDENVGYWVFDNNQTPTLAGAKTLTNFSGSISEYSIPGSDVIYTITSTNTGSGPVDANSIFLVDSLPPEVTLFDGDMDGAGPATLPVLFTDTDSGLTFGSGDYGYSTGASAPTDFSQCTTSPPTNSYRPDVTYICFAPQGAFDEGTITPSEFSVSFRARID